MAVEKTRQEYEDMKERWKRCRDCYKGEDAVHDAGDVYLPRLKDQPNTDYENYKKRTPFYNAFYRTVSGLVGMVFRIPPKIDVAESVKPLLEDVTLSGQPLSAFAEDVVLEAIEVGRLGILVDCPELLVGEERPATQLDAITQNIRPTLQLYTTESIINWRVRKIDNAIVTTLVVLFEPTKVEVNEFEEKTEERYRVLDLTPSNVGMIYRVRLYRRNRNDRTGAMEDELLSEVVPLMNGKPMTFIPFVFMAADELSDEVEDPPFIDLANMNLSHYRTSADYEHGAHFTGLPTPYVAGFKPDKVGEKLYIGSSHAWTFGSDKVKVGYLEFSGSGLTTLKDILGQKEQQMAVLGARMLEPQKKAPETTESKSITRKGEESLLAQIADNVSMGVERALTWFCMWTGVQVAATGSTGTSVVFKLNKDFFPEKMQPGELTALVGAWQQGAISEETMFDNLKRGEIVPQDRDFEEEQVLILEAAERMRKLALASGQLPPADDPANDPNNNQNNGNNAAA